MSRDLSDGLSEAIQQRSVQLALLLEAEVASSTVRYWTGLGTLQWNDVEWTGLGGLIGVGTIEETEDLKATGVSVTLRGVKAADVSLALNELRLNKPGSIRLAAFEAGHLLGDTEAGDLFGEAAEEVELGEGADYLGDGAHVFGHSVPETWFGTPEGGLVLDPKLIFRGRFDAAAHDDGDPEAPVLSVNFESDQIDLERPKERRMTDESQKALYPGDRALEFMAKLQDKEIIFGRR